MKDIDFRNKRALVRVDFNVPLDENYNITDDTRIRRAIPTIQKIREGGGSVVLLSHLGRPQKKLKADGSIDVERFTLRHVVDHLSELLGTEVKFAEKTTGADTRSQSFLLNPGEVLLVENTRFNKGESSGDEDFAAELANLGDVYINDAFGTAHRAHASTTVVAQYFDKDAKSFGDLMKAEIKNADKVLKSPDRPLTAILGGAKVSDKILLIERMLDFCENVIVGGGMAYTFVLAQGGKIGNSISEPDKVELALKLLKKAKDQNVDIYLPSDTVIASSFSNDAERKVVPTNEIPDGWEGLDIGPDTIKTFSKVIKNSQTVLWNGPMGVFEFENFAVGTNAIADAVVEATEHGAFTLVGGGDSVSALNKAGKGDLVSFVSTGGGAMLEYLEGKTLPGIKAILD